MSQSSILVARDADPGDLPSSTSPLGLSMPSCRLCRGSGLVRAYKACRICACVLRRVFRACLTSYRHCQASMGSVSGVQLERVGHAQGRCSIIASFKRSEYAADFVLLAKRVLVDRPLELAVFESYHLADLEWHVAAPRVNRKLHPPRPLDRGRFFHAVYRVETLLGKAIVHTRPYSLFPPNGYFSGFIIPPNSLSVSRIPKR